MEEMLKRLNIVTAKCREDMHESDEQGLKIFVFGDHLDNAFGDNPSTNCEEFTICIERPYGNLEYFNLATLIALARKAELHDQVTVRGPHSSAMFSADEVINIVTKAFQKEG